MSVLRPIHVAALLALATTGPGLLLVAWGQSVFDGFQIITYPTYAGAGDPRRVFVLAVEPGAAITAGGLEVDALGNMYVADFGLGGIGLGRLFMIPKDGGQPLLLAEGIDRPSDIELFPDGRGLLVGGPDGRLYRFPFGLSIRLDIEGGRSPVVFVRTDSGTYSGRLSGDGYVHFPGLLASELQQTPSVDVVVMDGGASYLEQAIPLQTFHGSIHGHSILEICIPE